MPTRPVRLVKQTRPAAATLAPIRCGTTLAPIRCGTTLAPILCAATLAPILCAATAAAQPLSAEETGRIVRAVDGYLAVTAKAPDLWPGFDPAAIAVAVYRRSGSALVIGHPSLSAGQPVRLSGAGPHARARLVRAPASWRGEDAADLGGVPVGRVPAEEILAASDPGATGVAALAHAAFHAWQAARVAAGGDSARAGRRPAPLGPVEYPDDDAANDAGIELETILIERTLREDPLAWPARAAELLALRAERRRGLPESARAFEDDVELHDGIAVYAERRALRAAAQAGILDAARADAAIAERDAARTDAAGRLARAAAGIAALLDRLEPGWRETCAATGEPPGALLARAARGRASAAPARARLGWRALLAESERRLRDQRNRREMEWGRIDAAGGRGTIELDLAPSGALGGQNVEPTEVARIDAVRRVHRERLVVDLGEAGRLEATGPVGEDRGRLRYLVRAPAGLAVTADGVAVPLHRSAALPFVELRAQGDGVLLKARGGMLDVGPGGHVRVRPFAR